MNYMYNHRYYLELTTNFQLMRSTAETVIIHQYVRSSKLILNLQSQAQSCYQQITKHFKLLPELHNPNRFSSGHAIISINS